MIPGWITSDQPSELLELPLPVAHEDTYSEGEAEPSYIQLVQNNFVLVGDGYGQSGVGAGAGSLAAQLRLGRLNVYDIVLIDSFDMEAVYVYEQESCPSPYLTVSVEEICPSPVSYAEEGCPTTLGYIIDSGITPSYIEDY